LEEGDDSSAEHPFSFHRVGTGGVGDLERAVEASLPEGRPKDVPSVEGLGVTLPEWPLTRTLSGLWLTDRV